MKLVSPTLARSLCSVLLLALCYGCGGGGPVAVRPQAAVTGIDPLPGDVSSQALAVSEDGAVVVGISKSISGKSQAFRWSAFDGITGLGFMDGGTASRALAVSADGGTVVGDGDAKDASAAVFRWSASSGLVQLKALADSKLCAAGGVSGDGNIVVGTCLTTGNSAFRWTEMTGMVALGQFGTGSNRTSNATSISTDASTIVGIGHPVLTGAVLWNSLGEASILGRLAGDSSAGATAVSRDGHVVVGYSIQTSAHQRAFRWTRQTGMTAIGATTDLITDEVASAVSGDGRVIVGSGITPDGETALIWDEAHGLRRLEDVLKTDYQDVVPGWLLARATGISGDGRTIVGFGVSPSGQATGWVLKFSN